MAGNSTMSGRSVTSRALDVLAAFDLTHTRQSLSEIARRSGIPIPTCHRLLRDLTSWGAVQRHADDSYTIGTRLARLGMLAPIQRGLRRAASPIMQDVLFATRQIVNLVVLDGTEAVVLERISGTQVGAPVAPPGERVPLQTTAGGKVLFAFREEHLWDAATRDMPKNTSRSIHDVDQLRRQLSLVRERGYATTEGEHRLGTHGLAVPIHDGRDNVIAALGMVSLTGFKEVRRIVPTLQVAAAAITRSLSAP